MKAEENKIENAKAAQDDIRQGFVYRQVPHITLKSIANNKDVDAIWEKYEKRLLPLRKQLSKLLGKGGFGRMGSSQRDAGGMAGQRQAVSLMKFWQERIARQKEMDASISKQGGHEFLYDKPYVEKNIVRVAGPFTVKSLSPHRMLTANEDGDFINPELEEWRQENIRRAERRKRGENPGFVAMILESLRAAAVQQAHKEDKIEFSSLEPWPGECIADEKKKKGLICAEGIYAEGDADNEVPKRAAIFIGPEYGTVSRADLVDAAREAWENSFDVLVACAFNYDVQVSNFQSQRIPILRAWMNADLHMVDLKNTGKGNWFVIFGEPDVTVTTGRWLVHKKVKMIANYDQAMQALQGTHERDFPLALPQ